jgi:GT2 family glycosyltransferase
MDVFVLAHDHWDLTERCLECLRAQTQPHTLTVIDNGSSDGTPGRARAQFPEARVIELGRNVGFAAANNHGVQAQGTGGLVILLNNDVECRPDFLERLVAPFARDEEVGSVAALLLSPGEERVESFGVAVDSTLAGFPRLRGRSVLELHSDMPVLAGPSGAAAAYRRAAWEQVGGLDEGVFAYGEDVDLALRLRAAGWKATAAPDAVAVHVGSASAGVRSTWQRYQGGFSRGYFLRRYGVLSGPGALRGLATETIVVGGDTLLYSHDLAALRGRIAGWRAAAGLPRRQWPEDVVDRRITLTESLRLRRHIYTCT